MEIFTKTTLSFFVLTVLSCSSIRKQTKKALDVKTNNDITLLNGCFSNNSNKALNLFRLLTNSKEKFDTSFTKYKLCISSKDNHHIQVKLYQDSSITTTQIIKGNYADGYFIKRRWKSRFMFGPVYWSLTDQLIHMGVNNNDELAVVYTTGGQLFFLFFPFMAAQGPDVIYKYKWVK